ASSLAKPAERVHVLSNANRVMFAPGENSKDEGHLLWIRDRTLMAQRFNPRTLKLVGEPQSLVSPVGGASVGGRTLLYSSTVLWRQFRWLDANGNLRGLLGEPGAWSSSSISPDDRRVAAIRIDSQTGIWLIETNRGVATRLTSGPALRPIWSP